MVSRKSKAVDSRKATPRGHLSCRAQVGQTGDPNSNLYPKHRTRRARLHSGVGKVAGRVQRVQDREAPGHVVRQLLREEVVGDRVQPPAAASGAAVGSCQPGGARQRGVRLDSVCTAARAA